MFYKLPISQQILSVIKFSMYNFDLVVKKIFYNIANNLLVFDASSKLPDGVFNGNNHLVGAIHECMAVETPSLLKWGNDSFVEGFK